MSKSKQFDRMRRAAREIGVQNLKGSGRTLASVRAERRAREDERLRRERMEYARNELARLEQGGYGASFYADSLRVFIARLEAH